MIAAADFAYHLGEPLNHLLTVRWTTLDQPSHPDDPLARVLRLVDLLRRWLNKRRLGACYIWVREIDHHYGEHFHFAFHMPEDMRRQLYAYLENYFGELKTGRRRSLSAGRTEGELACSVNGSWHVATDVKPERHGYWLAAYLGKGEPNEHLFRGRLAENGRKIERKGKYGEPQGEIVGTATRAYRHGVSQNLKPKAREKAESR